MQDSCFICHSSIDAHEAMELAKALESKGCICWIAPRDIPAGSTYPHEIVEGIRKCGTFLILLTNQASTSTHILRELETAQGMGKKIVPLRVNGVVLGNSMEYLLASLQWIEVTAGELWSSPSDIADRILAGPGTRLSKKTKSPSRKLVYFSLALAVLIPAVAWTLFGKSAVDCPVPLLSTSGTSATIENESKPASDTSPPASTKARPLIPVAPVTPVPTAPAVVRIARPSMPLKWICRVDSKFKIDWEMDFRRSADDVGAFGNKAFVDGNKAGKRERATTWKLDGTLNGRTWTGTCEEDAQTGKKSFGTFEVVFSEDFQSFRGTLFSAKNAKAGFSGSAR